jgi:hypothetical protein
VAIPHPFSALAVPQKDEVPVNRIIEYPMPEGLVDLVGTVFA